MRLSNYAIPVEVNNERYMFNTLNKSLVQLDPNLSKENLLTSSMPESSFQLLSDCAIVVNDNYNEFEEAMNRLYEHHRIEHDLFLTIQVTNACNCECIYCYEKGMYKQTKPFSDFYHLSSFIEELKRDFNLNKLFLSFHGGEPSLHPSVMTEIYDTLAPFFPEIHTNMVSNGVRLHERAVLQTLLHLQIEKILITVDGDQLIHDQRRPMKNGQSAFRNILLSLEALRQNSIPIHISMNIDKDNAMAVDYVYNHIVKKYAPENFFIAKICEGKENSLANTYTYEEFSNIKSEFYNRVNIPVAQRLKLNKSVINTCLCSNKKRFEFIIDALGDVYKCISLTGEKEFSIGNISDGFNNVDMMTAKHINNLLRPECTYCCYLPICYGGCQLGKFNNESDNGCLYHFLQESLPKVIAWEINKLSTAQG